MTDIVLTGLSLMALLAAYPLMVLHDTLRHREPRFQVHAREGRMTDQGVPYVPGSPS